MFFLLKASAVGEDAGSNFELIANIGYLSPSIVTKSELISGILVFSEENATTVTVLSTGSCSNFITVPIVDECVGDPSPTVTPTPTITATPTETPDEDDSFSIYTPIREGDFTRDLIENVSDLDIGETFEIPVFDESVIFTLKSKQTRNDGTIFVKSSQTNNEEDPYVSIVSKRIIDNSLTIYIYKNKKLSVYGSYNGVETFKIKEFEYSNFHATCSFNS